MASPVVTYELDDATKVRFEIEPTDEWREVAADRVLGRIREAVEPAVEGARIVLDKIREVGPDEIEVKFGIKVSGDMNWSRRWPWHRNSIPSTPAACIRSAAST